MSLSRAIILSSHNEMIEDAKRYILLLGKLLKEDGYDYYSFSLIMPDKYVAPILLTGILAPVLGLTLEKCHEDLRKISNALDERLNSGIINTYSDMSWEELLKKISDKENKDILLSAATKEDIEKTEERLKIKLPKEYKKFLEISNGLEALFDTNPTLLPVDRIDWLEKLDPELINIWCSEGGDDKSFVKALKSSLLIGGFMEEQQLLLILSNKSKDWECWYLNTDIGKKDALFNTYSVYMEVRNKWVDAVQNQKSNDIYPLERKMIYLREKHNGLCDELNVPHLKVK